MVRISKLLVVVTLIFALPGVAEDPSRRFDRLAKEVKNNNAEFNQKLGDSYSGLSRKVRLISEINRDLRRSAHMRALIYQRFMEIPVIYNSIESQQDYCRHLDDVGQMIEETHSAEESLDLVVSEELKTSHPDLLSSFGDNYRLVLEACQNEGIASQMQLREAINQVIAVLDLAIYGDRRPIN